jgi:molybdate transport system substrate-binding protein
MTMVGRALLGLLMSVGVASQCQAAELRVLSANVFTNVLDNVFRDFERASGHHVTFVYVTAGVVKSRIQAGEVPDVAILPRPMLDELTQQGKIDAGTVTDLAHSAVSVVTRANAAKLPIGSVDEFKRSLLTVQSISYPNPAGGGATGVLITRVFDRLGVADAMKPKTKFPPPGHFAAEVLAAGEVDLALSQPMEVIALASPTIQMQGLMPAELQDPPAFTFGGSSRPGKGSTSRPGAGKISSFRRGGVHVEGEGDGPGLAEAAISQFGQRSGAPELAPSGHKLFQPMCATRHSSARPSD